MGERSSSSSPPSFIFVLNPPVDPKWQLAGGKWSDDGRQRLAMATTLTNGKKGLINASSSSGLVFCSTQINSFFL